jgi:hypothetical protein
MKKNERRYRLTASDYLRSVPERPPEGRVLVHNQVRPRRILGMGGFRAWSQPLDASLEECRCGWAGFNADGHFKHYRKIMVRPRRAPTPR